MPFISQICIDEVIANSPTVDSLNADWLRSSHPTVYVCAQGFEDRCTEVAELLSAEKTPLKRVVVISLRSNSDKDQENGRRVIEMLRSQTECDPILFDGDEPGFHSRMVSALGGRSNSLTEDDHILLDISVAANRACLRAIDSFLRHNCQLTVAYAEAAVYHPEEQAFRNNEATWISEDSLGTEKGVEDISRCEEFLGEHLDAASNVVVLFPSFRHERSAAVISHVDPALLINPTDDVIWVLGRPHLDQDLWRRDAMRKINKITDEAKVFDASTFDYREAWRILEQIYNERWEGSNITLSPLGSKMQALAVTLFCIRHPDVLVLLSTPQQYNSQQWSDGVRDLWRVSFGSAREFVSEILRAGTLKLEGLDL